MATSEEGRLRCQDCRYWFQRCCHALAMRDKDDRNPLKCPYFIGGMARSDPMMEQASC